MRSRTCFRAHGEGEGIRVCRLLACFSTASGFIPPFPLPFGAFPRGFISPLLLPCLAAQSSFRQRFQPQQTFPFLPPSLPPGATENELLLRELQATAADQERTAKAQTEEIATLRQSLSMAALRSTEPATGGMLVVGEGQAGGGVGVGLTECNPDVVRSIRSLEAEVERLRAQISDTAVEKMEALEAEKDRHRRLAESFEER